VGSGVGSAVGSGVGSTGGVEGSALGAGSSSGGLTAMTPAGATIANVRSAICNQISSRRTRPARRWTASNRNIDPNSPAPAKVPTTFVERAVCGMTRPK
jgi:hypothetical protein